MTTDLIILENDYPIFNPEARLIKEYRAIIARDKGSAGDSQGRNKSMATKELAFVMFFSNLKSIYHIQYEDEATRAEEIRKALELPADWKIDAVMKAALKEYEKTQVTPSSSLLISVRRALNTSKRMVTILEKEIESDSILLEGENPLEDGQREALIKRIKGNTKEVIKIAGEIAEQLETLDVLENKYVKELEIIKGRKNGTVNTWEL